ncbi:glycosyltransferase [Rhodococcus sp. (in: high G+C Gram-positive bacteria)]|uniref:glycosyltransferase n=1 Tax=Rhodococcus sp. TaxID=1831 RepID=UPI003B8A8E8E
MKIAMISDHASPLVAMGGVDTGGQNVHVAALSAALVRRGHDVEVFTRRDDESLPERVRSEDGYDVVHVPAGPATRIPKDALLPHMQEFALGLRDRFAQSQFDVAHSHFWMSGLTARLASRACGVPLVHTFHALGIVKKRYQGTADTSPPERIPLECKIGQSVDAVAATCSDEVFELVRMGIPRSRITVVPCGVDTEEFRPDGPRAPHGDRFRLTTVGRLVRRKGFDVAIRALAALPDTELVIAGGPVAGSVHDDEEGCRLLRLADELGVRARLVMPGQIPRDRMPELLRSSDVVVCSPWYEPFGIVPLEAMACGKPVVASAVGGLTDTVVDGVTGVHVPPRNADALGRALRRLLTEPVQCEQLGHAGRDRAVQRFSWNRVAGETERVYESVLREAVPRAAGGVGR